MLDTRSRTELTRGRGAGGERWRSTADGNERGKTQGTTVEMEGGVEGTSGRWGAQENTTKDDKKNLETHRTHKLEAFWTRQKRNLHVDGLLFLSCAGKKITFSTKFLSHKANISNLCKRSKGSLSAVRWLKVSLLDTRNIHSMGPLNVWCHMDHGGERYFGISQNTGLLHKAALER